MRPVTAVRFLRGLKARTKDGLLDECAAALQFPPYFGGNWDALLDCLRDLSWLRADAYVLCVLDAAQFLADAPAEDLKALAGVLQEAMASWNHPPRSHRARPFHVVLQTTPADEKAVKGRWHGVGWKLDALTV